MGMSYCRYYGRRKAQEDSDSELSGLEDEKADIGGARAQLRWFPRKMRPNQYFLSAGPIKAMPMVVMEKCGVRAPKSVRLLTCMAIVSKNPLLNHLLWNPSSILLKLFLTLVSIQEESKALTIKEKLKRKMQQQLKKTFKVSCKYPLLAQP